MYTMDIHATILALMELNHKALTFPYSDREFRLTDVGEQVYKAIFALFRAALEAVGKAMVVPWIPTAK